MVPTLRLGAREMPVLGYGVGTAWYKASGDKAQALKASLQMALDAGVRHIDDAEMYQNEVVTGEAIRQWLARTGTKREELFITNKFIDVDKGACAVCDELLAKTGLEYFDLFLVHSCCTTNDEAFKKSLPEIWEEMMTLHKSGKVKEIGVSNWRICDLESIKDAPIQPCCNQVEAHPFLQQAGLLEYCKKRNILVTCYGPQAPLYKDFLQSSPELCAVVQQAAKRAQLNEGQVLLRWAYQTGRVPITTTSKPERMQEYLKIFESELTDSEVAAISAAGLRAPQRRVYWTQCPKFFAKDPSTEPESAL
ncbi:unnamed protein product [Effrenium voratum]|nr:unnamed protein product [Effrenium voratum]